MGDRARKNNVVASELCQEKWVAHCQKLHRERLNDVKYRIDNGTSEAASYKVDKFNSPNRRALEANRQAEIDTENRILFEKMVKIKTMESAKVFKPWLGRSTFQWRPGHYYDPTSNAKVVDHINCNLVTSPISIHHSSKVVAQPQPSYKETHQNLMLAHANSKLFKAIEQSRSLYSCHGNHLSPGVAPDGSRELRFGGLQEHHVFNSLCMYRQSNFRGPEWARFSPTGSPPKRLPRQRPGSADTEPIMHRRSYDSSMLKPRVSVSASGAPRPSKQHPFASSPCSRAAMAQRHATRSPGSPYLENRASPTPPMLPLGSKPSSELVSPQLGSSTSGAIVPPPSMPFSGASGSPRLGSSTSGAIVPPPSRPFSGASSSPRLGSSSSGAIVPPPSRPFSGASSSPRLGSSTSGANMEPVPPPSRPLSGASISPRTSALHSIADLAVMTMDADGMEAEGQVEAERLAEELAAAAVNREEASAALQKDDSDDEEADAFDVEDDEASGNDELRGVEKAAFEAAMESLKETEEVDEA